MKRLLIIFTCSLFSYLPTLVVAQQKLAVVDLEQALNNSAYAKAQHLQLQNDETYRTNIEAYNKLGAELEKMQEDAKVNSVTWSDRQKQAFNADREEKLQKINAIRRRIEVQNATVSRNILQVMTPTLKEAVRKIIDDRQLDLLLKDPSVIFYKPSLDLTDELTSLVDELQAAE
ncbi:MAG: Skp family chaperone for outer membrane protein [Cellvibrionaceae bacterium]|jgi:Skp family chaperone for outer membrane proteins